MSIQPYYDRAGITEFHGDCLAVLPALASDRFDMVLTDPPYGVAYGGRWDGKRTTIVGDDTWAWLRPAFADIYRVLKPDSFCVSFYGWPHADIFLGAWKEIGFRPVSHFAFVKNVWGLDRFTRGKHETAFLLAKGSPSVPDKVIGDVIDWQRDSNAFHPNHKPVAALIPLLRAFVPEGSVVVDPFTGSGSTLRAAKDLGLVAVGIEIEEIYCRRAVKRMAQDVIWKPKVMQVEPVSLFRESPP